MSRRPRRLPLPPHVRALRTLAETIYTFFRRCGAPLRRRGPVAGFFADFAEDALFAELEGTVYRSCAGRDTTADWEVIRDEEQIAEPYRVIIKGNPSHSRHSGITLGDDGNVNPDELRRASSEGAAVVRLRPRQAR